MNKTVALSGEDTIIVNNRILADLGDGDVVTITFPNDIANVKTGKNGSSIYGFNSTGKQADAVMRVVRGSSDDKFLNNLMAQQQNNFSSFVLLNGEFTKQMGDGSGKVTSDTYILSGGIFSKQVESKSSVEGDTEQSISVYNIRFSNGSRVIA